MMNKLSTIVISVFLFTGCAGLTPDFYKTVDNIATDDAITVKCDRDCFKKNTDVSVSVEVKNKE